LLREGCPLVVGEHQDEYLEGLLFPTEPNLKKFHRAPLLLLLPQSSMQMLLLLSLRMMPLLLLLLMKQLMERRMKWI